MASSDVSWSEQTKNASFSPEGGAFGDLAAPTRLDSHLWRIARLASPKSSLRSDGGGQAGALVWPRLRRVEAA